MTLVWLITLWHLSSSFKLWWMKKFSFCYSRLFWFYFLIVLVFCFTSSFKHLFWLLDVTVFRVSDWCSWVNLCKISNMISCFSAIQRSLSVFCFFMFAVFINCWYARSSFSFNYYTKLITYTANNHLNPKLIPELLNNLGVNACDVMPKLWHKS